MTSSTPGAALLVAGTTSDAGKSVVTTGLCRAFARRGLRVAPFKSQNMSNNSMVVARSGPDGRVDPHGAEMGRAQWVQALAARAEPETAMNPVLLKPGTDRRSHVVLHGHPAGHLDAREFASERSRAGGRARLAHTAYEAFDALRGRHDLVVCEGAGSPAETNLRQWDYVNLGLAQHGQVPTVIVGDIDRGGVFAAMYGTVGLLDDADRALVTGFVINKFRGDDSLLAPAIRDLKRRTGIPVLGVLPWSDGVWLDSEDALDVSSRRSAAATLRVAVVRLPRISNFTDVDALGLEPGLDVVFASSPRAVSDADLVVLPGTRATVADLAWLRERGLDTAILSHARAGLPVLGICGGFQMLGAQIHDPSGVEGVPGSVPGLGLLDATTTFHADKVLGLPHGEALGAAVTGYEIHHGRVCVGPAAVPFLGGARDGAVFGTMWHGCLESDEFRRALLDEVAAAAGRRFSAAEVSFDDARQARLDCLGDLVEAHLDVGALLELARTGAGEAGATGMSAPPVRVGP